MPAGPDQRSLPVYHARHQVPADCGHCWQALISAVFQIIAQAIKQGFLPRFAILHTSRKHAGQLYVPFMNWLLMVLCILVVATFQTSAKLGRAYGEQPGVLLAIPSTARTVLSHRHSPALAETRRQSTGLGALHALCHAFRDLWGSAFGAGVGCTP